MSALSILSPGENGKRGLVQRPAEGFGRGSPREFPKRGRVLDAKEEGAGSRQSEVEHLAWGLPGSFQCLLLTLPLGTWELGPLCFVKSKTS